MNAHLDAVERPEDVLKRQPAFQIQQLVDEQAKQSAQALARARTEMLNSRAAALARLENLKGALVTPADWHAWHCAHTRLQTAVQLHRQLGPLHPVLGTPWGTLLSDAYSRAPYAEKWQDLGERWWPAGQFILDQSLRPEGHEWNPLAKLIAWSEVRSQELAGQGQHTWRLSKVREDLRSHEQAARKRNDLLGLRLASAYRSISSSFASCASQEELTRYTNLLKELEGLP